MSETTVSTVERLAAEFHERLVGESAVRKRDVSLEQQIDQLLEGELATLDSGTRATLRNLLSERSLGLGRLEALLADPDVDEVMISGVEPVWIERAGRIEQTAVQFESIAELEHTIDRILSPLGRRVDESEPMVDARLPDGSRVNVTVPPLAIDGPTVTIRRFSDHRFTLSVLEENGSLAPGLARLLEAAIEQRMNIVIAGGTGSGKTTLLNALSDQIPACERVITVEDIAELRLRGSHVIRLESRPAGVDGRSEVTIRKLVKNALRMRPDRIVVGEVRGGEALDMLSAMATGHDGSLSTVHAPDPEAAMRRLVTLSLMADLGLPHHAVREQLRTALDLVVQVSRLGGGGRAVVAVAEVLKRSEDDGRPTPLTQTVFRRGREGAAEWSPAASSRMAGVLSELGLPVDGG